MRGKIAPSPPRMSLGSIEIREGRSPLELSPTFYEENRAMEEINPSSRGFFIGSRYSFFAPLTMAQ